MARIQLEGMEFFAYHGCFREERVIGTRFQVDLSLEVDTQLAEQSDDIHHTVNYQTVYALVKTEMEQHAHLLEHVASRILQSVKSHFPQIITVQVKVAKLNPALAKGGKLEKVGVTLEG